MASKQTESSTVFDMRRTKSGSLYGVGGSDFYLLQMLAEHFPFRYEIFHQPDNIFGVKEGDGNWTGMIGMIQQGEVDMAISWMGCTEARLEAVDFSYPYLIITQVFFTAAPGLKEKEFPFLDPFQFLVWGLLLLSLPISSAILHILASCNKHNVGFARGWIQESYNLFALLLGQGSYESYKKTKAQIFMYFWGLSKVVLVFSYTGTLLASLMLPQRERPLKDIHELRDAVVSGKYQFGTFKGTSLMANLMAAKDGVEKDLADHIRDHPENKILGVEDAIARAEAGKFAILVPGMPFIITVSSLGIDKFYFSDDPFVLQPFCIAIRKGFKGRERLDLLLHRIAQSGIYDKIINDLAFQSRLKAPPEAPVDSERPLSLSDMKTALQLWGAGLLTSAVCLVFEICFYRYQKGREKSRRSLPNKLIK